MTDEQEERRRAKRHELWIPVQVESGPDVQMLAVSRNISWSGALVVVGATLEVGERVDLTLTLPGEDPRKVQAEIVRVEVNEEDPDGVWRYRLGLRFDEDVEDLEPVFERMESQAAR